MVPNSDGVESTALPSEICPYLFEGSIAMRRGSLRVRVALTGWIFGSVHRYLVVLWFDDPAAAAHPAGVTG
jgi:hypothetical protein